MKPCMYIILNAGADMSSGKLAAQAAHAAVEAYAISEDNNARRVWRRGGHYMKVVLRATDAEDLRVKERYINDRGFRTALIIDEGRTEVDPFTPTAIGVEILDKDDAHVAATFSTFKLYREPDPREELEDEQDEEFDRIKDILRRLPNPYPPRPPFDPYTPPPILPDPRPYPRPWERPWIGDPVPFSPRLPYIWSNTGERQPVTVTFKGSNTFSPDLDIPVTYEGEVVGRVIDARVENDGLYYTARLT